MVNKLLKVDNWNQWDIQIEADPQVIESRRLAVPELIHKDEDKLFVSEPLLKKLPVNEDKLGKTTLVLLFDER